MKPDLIMTNTRERHTAGHAVREFSQADRMLADGADVAAGFREFGAAKQTYCRWRNQYGGFKAEDTKCLKELAERNFWTRAEGVPPSLTCGVLIEPVKLFE